MQELAVNLNMIKCLKASETLVSSWDILFPSTSVMLSLDENLSEKKGFDPISVVTTWDG